MRIAVSGGAPWWAKSPVLITVRGRSIPAQPDADGFMVVKRTWKNNEIIDIEFPMSLYAEKMPDDSNRIAILYGPLVLAGNLGDTMPDPVYGTPVLLTDDHRIDRWITRDESHPLLFRTHGVGKPVDVSLSPF